MTTFDDSVSPYGNKFSAAKRYSKILARPGRPLFNWEILEQQSIQNYGMQMLGDAIFQEGAIISGMDAVPKAFSDNSTTLTYPNNFSIASLEAVNSSLKTDTYTSNGVIGITSVGVTKDQFPEMDFSSTITKGLYQTQSFTIQKTSGTFSKMSIKYNSNQVTPASWTIDGKTVATSLNDMTGSPLLDSSGNAINLDDGNAHAVIIQYTTLVSGAATFNLVLNSGYNALTQPVAVNITGLMSEDGQVNHAWVINSKDASATSSIIRTKTYAITPGRIWLEGGVREFDGDEISITGIGKETIGVKLSESAVTSADDPSLIDTTPNAVSYGKPGADRVKYQVSLAYNDDTAVPIYVFNDNKLGSNQIKPDYGSLQQILAKRMYDQSGHFRVYGFNVSTADYSLDDSKIRLIIDAGQAYVHGYSVNTSDTTDVLIDKADTTNTVETEQYIYNDANGTYTLLNQPVQTVNSVTGSIQGSNASVTRSTNGVDDVFTTETVYRIESVTQGSTTYIEGTDFVRLSSNSIRWGKDASGNTLTGANIPAAGSSYRVVYDYTKQLTEGKDYVVGTSGASTTINIASQTGLKPIYGSLVNVNYTFFLARCDMIVITQDANNPFKVIPGTPMPLTSALPPILKDQYSLELGYVLVYPNSDKALFTMQTITNIPFSGLQNWSTRLDNLEYNMSMTQMQQAIQLGEDPSTMKDTFSDEFNSVDKADTYMSDFNASYNLEDGSLNIPNKYEVDFAPQLDSTNSNVGQIGRYITSPYKEEVLQRQTQITDTINVNEYQVFNVNGSLSLNPSSDNWIDTKSTTVVDVSKNVKKINMYTYWKHGQKQLTGSVLNYFNDGVTLDSGKSWSSLRIGGKYSGYTISSGGTKTVSSAIEYMRQRRVQFVAKNFKPYTDNVHATITSIPVEQVGWGPDPSVDGGSGPYRGTDHNSWKADGNGYIYGSFMIPAGLKCGTRTVSLFNATNQATATYSAHGTLKDVEQIIKKQRVAVSLYDPLAQSFTFTDNHVLTGVGLYFQSKATVNTTGHTSDVIIQIRELSDDGYPNKTILGETTLSPDQINISSDGSKETKVTFDLPIQLTGTNGYCFTVITDSNSYNVFKATRGSRLIGGSNNVLQSRPSDNGNLFTSSNAQTWISDPNSSLKYNIYTANYTTSNITATFSPITLANTSYTDGSGNVVTGDNAKSIDRLAVLTSYMTPDSSSIIWYYRRVPDSAAANADINTFNWQPLVVNNGNKASEVTPTSDNPDIDRSEYDFTENTRQFQIKAVMSANQYTSPILYLDDLSVIGIKTDTSATYYSVGVDESGTAAFNAVKAQIDGYIPSGTSFTITYRVDNSNNWYTLTSTGTGTASPDSTTTVSQLFQRFVFDKAKVPTAVDQNHYATQIQFKIVLSTNSHFVKPRLKKFMTTMKVV